MEKVNNVERLNLWAREFFESKSLEIRQKKGNARLYIMKGPRFMFERVSITPIYGMDYPRYVIGDKKDLQEYAPSQLELLGFYSSKNGYFAVNSHLSMCFFSDDTVDSTESIMKRVRNEMYHAFIDRGKSTFDEIKDDPADESILQQNKTEAQFRYRNANPVKDIDEIIKKCFDTSNISCKFDRSVAGRSSSGDDEEKALKIFLNGIDAGSLIDQLISWDDCVSFLTNEKMIQRELQALYSSGVSDEIAVKLLFRKLKSDNVKTVQVTFDFGYKQVTEAVDVDSAAYNSAWFLKTHSASTRFAKIYRQRTTMADDYFNDWIRYVKMVKFRGKSLFECGKVDTPHAVENRLFSIIANLTYMNIERSMDEVRKCLENHLDRSVTDYSGRSLMYRLVDNRYATIELAQCLYEGGFRLQNDEIDMIRQSDEIQRLRDGLTLSYPYCTLKCDDYEKIIRLLGVLDA
ncbi:MAG: hypothetical protein K2K56_04415 [Lachnospiraceae bacterium]|nr:hypothetical protein [Lachnospiraceae bacterium]